MKWFFALNENSPGFWDYANLVQVAVSTARSRTTLEPVCIYDGAENALTRWLRAAGVEVVLRRTRLVALGLPLSAIARGAYLRLEVPDVLAARGWGDEFVLYTDCDVLFQRDPVAELFAVRPPLFAVAPESDRTSTTELNSGVMLLNVPAFRRELPALIETIRTHAAECLTAPYDQRALELHFGGRATRLADTFNWKPWWGRNVAAPIVHFHGPKPAQKYLLLNRQAPTELLARATPDYFAFCAEWDLLLVAALAAHPWPEDAPARDTPTVPEGFAGFSVLEGLAAEEGPFPQWFLPVVRWGLAPHTRLRVSAEKSGPHRLALIVQCPHAEQALRIQIDDTLVREVPIELVATPLPLALDVTLEAGEHEVRIAYARGFPSAGDPRPMAVMFRALRFGLA